MDVVQRLEQVERDALWPRQVGRLFRQVRVAELCGALPQRLPLDAAQDAAHKLLVELCVDHLEALDVAERQGEVGRVGAGARGAREEVLRDEADHLGGLKEGRRSTARVLRVVVSGLGAERDERGWSSRLEFER